jgi:hypothetical protein
MFDIATCTDFYMMVVQDFDEFMTETHSARKALHCAIAAYHLREWVWLDWLEHDLAAQNAIGIHDKNSFNAWVNRCCIYFPILRDLVNGTKHFEDRSAFETMRVMAVPFAWGQVTAGWGEGAWGGPIRYVQSSIPVGLQGEGYLLLDLGEDAKEHRWLPAAYLIEIVVRFWRDLFIKFRPTANLTHSRHHPLF